MSHQMQCFQRDGEQLRVQVAALQGDVQCIQGQVLELLQSMQEADTKWGKAIAHEFQEWATRTEENLGS